MCKDCKLRHQQIEEGGESHPISKVKHRDLEDQPKEETKEKDKAKSTHLDGMLEEYYNLGFEDIIGKDIYTRFKYTKVKDYDFGLSNEEILLLNDQELNKLVSLKKYKPYRNDEELTNIHRVRDLKRKFNHKIEDEKKQLKQVLKQDIEIQKEKLLGIKTDAKKVKKALVKQARIRDKLEDKKLKHEAKDEKAKERQERQPGKRDRKSLYCL